MGIIQVEGYASKPAWLGLTLEPDSYREKDAEAIKVEGNFSVNFNLNKLDLMIAMRKMHEDQIPLVACLWGKK